MRTELHKFRPRGQASPAHNFYDRSKIEVGCYSWSVPVHRPTIAKKQNFTYEHWMKYVKCGGYREGSRAYVYYGNETLKRSRTDADNLTLG